MPPGKDAYRLLSSVSYETLWNNRGKVIQAFPETAKVFSRPVSSSCSGCRKRSLARSILNIMATAPCRNVEILRGVLPGGLLECLRTKSQ